MADYEGCHCGEVAAVVHTYCRLLLQPVCLIMWLNASHNSMQTSQNKLESNDTEQYLVISFMQTIY